MGIIFPDNEKIGSVVMLENDGTNHFTNHMLLDKVARVTYVQAARLTKHSVLPDLVIGPVRIHSRGRYAGWKTWATVTFKSHQLLDLPGHDPCAGRRT
jgi:hypothetical protein